MITEHLTHDGMQRCLASYRIGMIIGMKKIAITIDSDALCQIDSLVTEGLFPNRSKVFQAAIQDKLYHLQRTRLYIEAGKLNSNEEQAIAEGLGQIL